MDLNLTEIHFSIVVFDLILSFASFTGFGESGDPSCIIMQIWAKIEVSIVGLIMVIV